MATVTGLTAERMLQVEAQTVVDGEVVGDHLILTKHDGTTIDAGDVRGPQGTSMITPRLVGDLPSAYTFGVTAFTFGAENPGWPVGLGTVFSYIENIARGFQIVTEKASGATSNMWIRIVGQDAWGPWMKLAGTDTAGNMTVPRIRLSVTSDASETSTDHPFQIGPTTGINLIIDDNEILGRNNGALSPIHFIGGLKTPVVPAATDDVANRKFVEDIHRGALGQRLLSGGGIRKTSSGGISWSQRLMVMGSGRISGSTVGYWEIAMPADGTVIPLYGSTGGSSVTVAGGIIPMAGWRALYYELPLTGNQVSLPGNFRLMDYTAASSTSIEIPGNWILICARNVDTHAANYLWGDGRVQDYWKLLTLTNSWVAYGSNFPAPAWRWTIDGRVELRGLMKSGTVGLATPFATLPYAEMAPEGVGNAGSIFITPASAGAYTARMDVLPDGRMAILALGTGATNSFVALENISWHPAGH